MATTPTPPPLASATNGNPSRQVPGTSPARRLARRSSRTAPDPDPGNTTSGGRRSRAGALWVAICVVAVLLVALIVFVLQNTQHVVVSFLGMQETVPLAVALLIAGVGVGIIALIVGSIRIAQLRRRLHQRG